VAPGGEGQIPNGRSQGAAARILLEIGKRPHSAPRPSALICLARRRCDGLHAMLNNQPSYQPRLDFEYWDNPPEPYVQPSVDTAQACPTMLRADKS